jgi:hypothetical protein
LYNKIRTNDNRYILRTTYPTFKDFATLKKNEFKTILKHNIGENQILNKLSWLIDKHPSNYKKTKLMEIRSLFIKNIINQNYKINNYLNVIKNDEQMRKSAKYKTFLPLKDQCDYYIKRYSLKCQRKYKYIQNGIKYCDKHYSTRKRVEMSISQIRTIFLRYNFYSKHVLNLLIAKIDSLSRINITNDSNFINIKMQMFAKINNSSSINNDIYYEIRNMFKNYLENKYHILI